MPRTPVSAAPDCSQNAVPAAIFANRKSPFQIRYRVEGREFQWPTKDRREDFSCISPKLELVNLLPRRRGKLDNIPVRIFAKNNRGCRKIDPVQNFPSAGFDPLGGHGGIAYNQAGMYIAGFSLAWFGLRRLRMKFKDFEHLHEGRPRSTHPRETNLSRKYPRRKFLSRFSSVRQWLECG